MSVVNPLIFRLFIDSVLGDEEATGVMVRFVTAFGGIDALRRNIWICCVAYVIVAVLNGFTGFLRGRSSNVAAENVAREMKDNLYDHLQKLPYDYHVKAQTGDLIQRCTSDVETIRRFLGAQMIEMARTLFSMVFALIAIGSISVKMMLISLIFLPIIFVFSYVFFKKVRQSFTKSDEKEGELSAVLQENLSGVRVVRAFGRERYEMDKFSEKNASLRKLNYLVNKLLAYYWSLSDVLCFAQIAAVLIVGIVMAMQGEITLGGLVAINSYTNMLIWPIRGLGRILSDMGKMQVSLGRVNEILDTPEEQDTPGAEPYPLNRDIVFENVTFEYEKDKPVLNGLSFAVKPGETIAILGPTGSGKSTLMHLLLRLYDYGGGSIKIGGVELRDIRKPWLRERVGIVLQEPFLFSKTIVENLRMAKDQVEDQEIYAATRTASVHDVIEGFDLGYSTILGERGVTLSGGQKQRVAIARTLIKNSDILIFDDSLSAVDTETDAQIRAALNETSRDVTTFIISQRITTLMNADRIFVIEGGRLTDSGTHKELTDRDGLYSRIWNIQSMLEDDFLDDVSEPSGNPA